MNGVLEFLAFEEREAASATAADLLAGLIRADLSSSPGKQVSMVVSGGSTPGRCFDLLSQQELDWWRVTVVPSDERWVPGDHPDSNERLIRTRLLTGSAAAGKALSFFRTGMDAQQAPLLIEKELAALSRPFSASLLGMGEDGHFASLFPDFNDLQSALDPNGMSSCTLVRTAASPHPRISLTLAALLDTTQTILLIFGEAKRSVIESASIGGSPYPIEALLQSIRKPLTVIWAP